VLSQLKDLDVDIYSYKQGIDTSTTMGSSFFHMVGIFAELETSDVGGVVIFKYVYLYLIL
jgi:DNA invertase Pin-like site-specific DNA recombinase